MRIAAAALFSLAVLIAAPAAMAQNILKDAGSLLDRFGGGSASLSESEVAGGLKDALRVGAKTVTRGLGQRDGFFGDAAAHIPLPGWMKTARKVMRLTGQAGLLDDIELRMNRAAEGSMDAAMDRFAAAIKQMTFDDARKILSGPDDAATRYFQGKMSTPLAGDMRPIVETELAKTDVFALYDRAAASRGAAGLAPQGKTLLIDHAVDGALKGLFHYIAEEEAAIRNNPSKRVTPLLQKVFR